MGKTILIVDDDPAQRRLLQAAVERNGFLTRAAENGVQAVEAVDKHADIDAVLLDLVMPGMSGQEALKEIRMRRGDLPCIVLTASGGIDTVVQAMQAGASDFFVKPASPERIMVSIRNALEMSNLKTEVVRLKKRASGQMSFDDMVANAPVMAPVVRMGKRAAASNIPVLITGESGVGKELLARAIQGASERAGRAFVTVNCGAIPENLVESILFGHTKGSFTGATDNHAGKFVEANGGTLFLDEVGELPLDMQVKLLRVLQEGEVDPVGAKRPVKVDVRIVSATNKDLAKLVADGKFREDLYYRLNVFPIEA
ncbi:MAG TPA: sigma-54 dependent transcriptional regulator, partial [Terricaulis sp.]|nr:sigma-54 dependent transcriptional regulator [Terricaulis sp.]